jgi:hypothetical protein
LTLLQDSFFVFQQARGLQCVHCTLRCMYRFFSDNYIVGAIAVVTSVCTLHQSRFFKFYLEPLASFWQTSASSKSEFSNLLNCSKICFNSSDFVFNSSDAHWMARTSSRRRCSSNTRRLGTSCGGITPYTHRAIHGPHHQRWPQGYTCLN